MFGLSNKAQISLGLVWLLAGILVGLLWLLDRPSIEIAWQTETEYDSAGFNVLRSEAEQGPFIKANDQFIPASEDASAGADYSYVDTDVTSGRRYYYRLEDVDLAGNMTQHELISVEAPGRPIWMLAVSIALILFGLIFITTTRLYN